MNSALRPALAAIKYSTNLTSARSYYWRFTRTIKPPLQQPRESPYIVGPYLKPDYVPVDYLTEPIKPRDPNDFDHYIYVPEKVEPDETRRIKLLLIEDVEGLGVAGQVVDAPYRFGASKLVAMKKADYYTELARKLHKIGPKTIQSASSALSPRTARLLRSQIFTLPISPTVKVEPWHISLALRLAGCRCPIEAIDKTSIEDYLDDQEYPHVKCIVIINNHERVEVKFALTKKQKAEDEDGTTE